MKLYKYVVPERTDVLSGMQIRFTPASEFNDPFEVFPVVKELVPEEQVEPLIMRMLDLAWHEEEYARGLYADELAKHERLFALAGVDVAKVLPFELAVAQARATAPELMRWFIQQVTAHLKATFPEQVRERLNTRFGILSLSEKWDNLLMWAHYADSHRGFVLEFDSAHPFFDQRTSAEDIIRHVQKVTYSAERPAVTLYDPSADPKSFFTQLAVQFFLTKSEDWLYEQEWRMILPLDADQHRGSSPAGLVPIPAECISGIILGARASASLRAEIKSLTETESLSHVRVFQAELESDRFGVRVTDLASESLSA